MSSPPVEADAGERIPLAPIPPAAPAPDSGRLVGRLRFLDGVLVLLVAAFAFLAACTRMGNSDLLLHLATGRLIAQGQFPFADPFTFTAGAWVNQSWLFDLVLYAAHAASGAGGEALTVLKALGFAGLAWLMLRAASKPGERLWIPAFCVLLAVLALSPRCLLNPMLASDLVLAGLVLLMARHQPGSRAIWAAPALCLLWANLDAWFFLGPLLMALFLLGRFLDARAEAATEAGQADLQRLALVAGACLLACLANPFLWNAFLAPPPELARFGAGGVLASPEPAGDAQFRGWQISVWDKAYYSRGVGLSPAGLAFFPLILLSIASFAAAFPEIRWWRALAWLATLALALLCARTVPFFAIVAGPIMALNFLDASTRLLGPRAYLLPNWRTWAVSGRVLAAFIALCLCLLSLPGWLQAQPEYRYRLGFGIEYDEGLRAAALRADDWRKQGALPAGQRWFNLSPEAANYFAWFCPGERMFIDQRLALFGTRPAQDFLAVRRSLMGQEPTGEQELSPMAWREVLAEREVRWVVFHAHSLDQALPILARLYSNPAEWTPCFAEGKAAIFAWRGPRKAKPAPLDPRLPSDFRALAFGPEAVVAPAEGPSANAARPWYAVLLEGEEPPATATATAQQQLCRFEVEGEPYLEASDRTLAGILTASLAGRMASLAGTPAAAAMPAFAASFVGIAQPLASIPSLGGVRPPAKPGIKYLFAERALRPWMRSRLDAGPPSALYLGIRAAREAVKRNPLDPSPHFLLSELYSRLAQRTREAALANGRLTHLQALRRAQAVAPLTAVLRLSPDRYARLKAHLMLVSAMRPDLFLDLHVHHLEELAKLCRSLGYFPNVPRDKVQAALQGLEKSLGEQKKLLAARRGKFEVQSLKKPAVERAGIARSLGLVEEAVKILSRAKPEEMGLPHPRYGTGLQMLASLLLATGRLEEARSLLVPPPGSEDKLDPSRFGSDDLGLAYQWFLVQLSAASGDYAEADLELARFPAMKPANPAVLRQLVQVDVLPEGFKPAAGTKNLEAFVALSVGDALLRGSREATRRPGDFWLAMPLGINPPHKRARQPWPLVLDQAFQGAGSFLGARADLLAIRAALALEQGRTAEARTLAKQSLALGRRFRSAPFAALVAELVESGKK